MSSIYKDICSSTVIRPTQFQVKLIHSALLFGIASALWISGKDVISSLVALSSPRRTRRRKRVIKLENWIEFQRACSMRALTAAFGPHGFNATGVSAGIMIASPSRPGSYHDPKTENENYYFNWTRDSALCLRVLLRRLDEIELGIDDYQAEEDLIDRLETIVNQFIVANSSIQLDLNPSGGPHDGGLGEPKFQIDGSRFDSPWGRPQNDGPAIRASTLIRYAKHLILDRERPQTGLGWIKASKLYDAADSNSQIILDIEHVRRTWRQPTFDLWEEVKADNGGHFYTLMVQRRSIQDYFDFIDLLPSESRPSTENIQSFRGCLEEMDFRLEEFWNPEGLPNREGGPDSDAAGLVGLHPNFSHQAHIVPTLERIQGQAKPSQVDSSVLLAIIHTVGPNQPEKWSPASDRALSTLDRLVRVFEKLYPINNLKSGMGIAIGRYPEDEYDGIVGNSIGHPWFLCTHATAEMVYLAINQIQKNQKTIKINKTNRSFFSRFLKNKRSERSDKSYDDQDDFLVGEKELGSGFDIERGDPRFRVILREMKVWADEFLIQVSQRFSDNTNGSMSEQINRFNGKMRGARELTWSYASFLTATDARQGKAPN
ncbi:Six-hairpin glycosidase-like protein [Phakopsora pachyrhizi]|uniref:Six-hairpin glycosidase-like protein n=1 Tax=Phakopsora pachyrhizi TaxID=170000 RepID=A0AAV0BWM2_PHAPC|nr:Six-hairpin glycosidase-like protein [Phakopsora pachyrhizi]CAH7689994.1 Six-hairpin glycosidase-like protein [Phakopsora pachyrhizi]